MILKVERHNLEQDWWLLDNISKVSCSKCDYKKGDSIVEGDIILFDHESECNCNNGDGCNKCIRFYKLICRTKEYDEFSIVFDTVAYLCNDEGKTIEKIVANYNSIGK